MNGLYTIILLILSNVFMTLAWYGHLKLQENGVSNNWPLIGVIVFSWGIAFLEYCCQVPANRLGFVENGGPFNLIQLKVIQECISLHHCQHHVSGHTPALEPYPGLLSHHLCCLSGIHEVNDA